jgi:sugar lactone lactonase YvrE
MPASRRPRRGAREGTGISVTRSVGAIAVVGLVVGHGLGVWPGTLDLRQSPRRLAVVNGLSGPEAVSYDSAHDAYYVSNVNGSVGLKDGNGFISRITADGQLDSLHFIQGGRNGVELSGPMGSRIRGDTLWVLDIDALRAFDTRTGAALATVDLTPVHPLLPNDLTFGPDDDIYITDTGLHVNPDGTSGQTDRGRIDWVTRDRRVTVALEDSSLNAPDGIAWDPRGERLLLAPIGGRTIQAWQLGDREPMDLAAGPGKFDGLEVEADGRVLLTSWNDFSVLELRGRRLVRRIGPLDAPPADIALDAARGRLGVAFLTANRFELWTLPNDIP